MGMFRLHAGADGVSRIEEIGPGDAKRLGATLPARAIEFHEDPAGTFFDWHPAPRRQWVIILSGQLEIGLGDGSVRRFGPGDARLVEDLVGRGHTTRVVGDRPCVVAFVPVKGADALT